MLRPVGMGGVGKTQLAAAHARQALDRGIGVVVWVTAVSRQAVIDAYADAAVVLGLERRDGRDREWDARRFLAWAAVADWEWLVVLDDVQDPDDVVGGGRVPMPGAGCWRPLGVVMPG